MTARLFNSRSPVFQKLLLCVGLCLPMAAAQAQLAAVTNSAVTSKSDRYSSKFQAQVGEWNVLEQYLGDRGLALAAQCVEGNDVASAQLVVLDSSKASEVLRGPLADGEVVETGGVAAQGASARMTSDEWSPDVHFNRRWLAAALSQHRFSDLANGAQRIQSGSAQLRLASR